VTDNIERQLREALADAAQSVQADAATVQRLLSARAADAPRSRDRLPNRRGGTGRHAGWLGPLLAAAAVVLVAGGVVAVTRTTSGHVSANPAPAPTLSAPRTTAAASASTGTPVRVSSVIGQGETVGVGMPIVLRLSPAPTDSTAFTKAVQVTVNGRPAGGAWFWEQPTADDKKSHTIEAHYRLKSYWPAGSTVRVSLPIGGLSAGSGMVYDDAFTDLTFHTGDAHVSVVDGRSDTMVVRSNDKTVKTFAVSLGKAATPTYAGVKVIMRKGEPDPATGALRSNGQVRVTGPGYDVLASWALRLTASGEYVLAAPWNSQLGQVSTSTGTTDVSSADAKWFYEFSQVGDVIQYTNTGGTTLPSWDGYGDWNVPWTQWRAGGLLANHG